MPQRFLCALAFTLTLTTNLNPMTRDDDHHDGSKLTLPHFDPKGLRAREHGGSVMSGDTRLQDPGKVHQ